VEGNLKFEQITSGGVHTCALTGDGAAYCWGANDSLQLGAASTEQCTLRAQTVRCQTHPVPVTGGYRFTSLAAGGWPQDDGRGSMLASHTCGVTTENDVVCWGWNGYGQVRFYGDDLATSKAHLPVKADLAGIKFRAVSAGSSHSCGITLDGRAYCWGTRTADLGFLKSWHVGAMEGNFTYR
jgi:alpha-tubulin suppressor-like RCC1 family protein